MPDELEPEIPDYFPEAFPRDRFPQYIWEKRPEFLPADPWISETTHRDGQQGGLPLSADRSIQIYDLMCDFTGTSGAIRHAEFFPYKESDRTALMAVIERYDSGAPIEPTTWIRAKREDIELIKSFGIRETGLLCSASDFHTFHKFTPGGRRQAAQRYLEAVKMTLDAGIRPRVHLEDTTRASMDFVKSLVDAVLKLAEPYGTALRPRFRICDTLGVGLPYDDVALPRSIPLMFRELRAQGLTPDQLEFHPHNDTGLVVANCLAALREGCGAISGTCLAKGERTGNAPVEMVILHLLGMGYLDGEAVNFEALGQLADLYAAIGEPIPPKYPLFGRDAHRTRAGVHADGLNKFWWMYAPFNVPALLGRKLEVSLTKDSGVAGVTYLIRQHLGLDLTKQDPRVLATHHWVDAQFDAGRITAIEWEELAPIVARNLEASGSETA